MITYSGRPRKDPISVRRRLLDSTAKLMCSRGFTGVSISDIASDAGVTKGGLFHHFASKQELIFSVFDDELERLSLQINDFLAQDSGGYGCFTRAYIKATLVACSDKASSSALTFSLCTETELVNRWQSWLAQRLDEHRETDSAQDLEIARFAADGIWFTSSLKGGTLVSTENIFRLQERLIALTMKSEKLYSIA